MTDPNYPGSTTPPPTPPPPTSPPGFPAMPKNPGAAFGMASGYFGGTSPSTLATHAVLLFVVATVISFIAGFIPNLTVVRIIGFPGDIMRDLAMVILVVAAARFVADAFRARG